MPVSVWIDVATGERLVLDPPSRMERTDGWLTAAGEDLPIKEMGTRHIVRVIAWLRRRPVGLKQTAYYAMFAFAAGPFGARGDHAQDAQDAALEELLEMDAVEWLESTPLMGALKAELVLRDEPWSEP